LRRRRRARRPRRKTDEARAATAAAVAAEGAARLPVWHGRLVLLELLELGEASLDLLGLRLALLQLCVERGRLRAASTRPNVHGRRTLQLGTRRPLRPGRARHLRRRLILLWITHHGAQRPHFRGQPFYLVLLPLELPAHLTEHVEQLR
jgi:hypothetical protein